MEFFVELDNTVKLQRYLISDFLEKAEFVCLALLALFIPIVFGHVQLLTGTIVNFLLVMAAINTRGWKKVIVLITLPSISALLAGTLFGSLTPALLYMIPFIWVGNALLVFVFKRLFVGERKNFFLTLAIAAFLKSAFLFTAAFLLYTISAVPALFLTAMGLLQLLTAIAGGTLAFPVNLFYKKKFVLARN